MIVTITKKDEKGGITKVEAGFKFNINYAFESLISMKGIVNFSAMGTAMLYCAYKAWCYAKQIDERLTFEDIVEWVDSGKNETEIRELTAEFEGSPVWKKVMESLKKNVEQTDSAPALN